jgi:uncharacterized protein YggE
MKTNQYIHAILQATLVIIATLGPRLAAEEVPRNTISVRASSSVSIKPDTIYISLYVPADGMLTEDAVKAANAKSDEIKGALTKVFPKLKDISIVPIKMGEKASRIYRSEDIAQPPRPEVINRLIITAEPALDRDLPKIIDTALRAGAVLQVPSSATYAGDLGSVVRYGIADYKRAEAETRSKALNDAREKASELAKAAGKSVGELVSIADEGASPSFDYDYTRSAKGKLPTEYLSFSNEPIEVRLFFRVTFELK